MKNPLFSSLAKDIGAMSWEIIQDQPGFGCVKSQLPKPAISLAAASTANLCQMSGERLRNEFDLMLKFTIRLMRQL